MIHYFDNAATTRVCREAIDAMVRTMDINYGNPSSTHSFGMVAEKLLKAARKNDADALGCAPDELFFTSGGTESDNWALKSGAESLRRRGKHIITTLVEHDAILNSAKYLESRGFEVTYLKTGADGRVSPEDFRSAIREDTVLASIMLVNNETGAVQPVKECAGILHTMNPFALFHTDAVQGFMKVPFTPSALGADMVSISSHKIHGPKGTGALYIRKGIKLPPFIHGGGQEKGQRSGTEGLPGIVGFGEACRVYKENFPAFSGKIRELRAYTETLIADNIPTARILPADAPHIMSLSLPGYRSEVIMNFLESRDVFVSKGSACTKGRRSHVLTAMELPNDVIDGTIRISFSRMTEKSDVDALVTALADASAALAHR